MMRTCALIIGHKASRPGAKNKTYGVSEFEFNEKLAQFVAHSVAFCKTVVVHRDTYSGLPDKINALKPDFVIALHCNAFNGTASGTETLYPEGDEESEKLAGIVQAKLVNALGLRDRGIKGKDIEDRGGFLLCNVEAPCALLEPFFIDNDKDLQTANGKLDVLAVAIIEAMEEYIETLN